MQMKVCKWTTSRRASPVDIYLFEVSSGNNRTMPEICSKSTIKTPERRPYVHFYEIPGVLKRKKSSVHFQAKMRLSRIIKLWIFLRKELT